MTLPPDMVARVAAVADRYRLAIPRNPAGGPAGAVLGAGTGSSLEFQDHRAYFPGDDLRHIDWSAYARSDQLTVQLYREEVAPRVELIVDGSASMAGEGKSARLAELLLLLVHLAGKSSAQPTMFVLGDAPATGQRSNLAEAIGALRLTGRQPMGELLAGRPLGLRPRSIRLVISDFLFPHDPDGLVSRLAEQAAAFGIVQLLSESESNPPPIGPARLEDVETGQWLELTADAAAVERYRARLTALQTGLAHAARRVGGTMCTVTDAPTLEETCRRVLAPSGMIEVG